MNPPPWNVSSHNRKKPDKDQWEERLSELKISIGPVDLYARLLDTPAAEAILAALPFSSKARVVNNLVSFSAPGAGPFDTCRPGGGRAGEFVLSHDGSDCGIDISNLPFTRSNDQPREPSADVWARSQGDIGALKHVINGDPVAVEAID
jgi:hypothetical protein